jgi:hypothetical protein
MRPRRIKYATCHDHEPRQHAFEIVDVGQLHRLDPARVSQHMEELRSFFNALLKSSERFSTTIGKTQNLKLAGNCS